MKDVRERLAMTVNDAQMKNGEWKGGWWHYVDNEQIWME